MNVLEKILEEIEEARQSYSKNRDMRFVVGADKMADKSKEITISHMDEIENDGWIPVEERLPEEKTEVLACFGNGTVQSLWQNWKNDGLGDYFDDDLTQTKVIAWRPLPEPCKPKKELIH